MKISKVDNTRTTYSVPVDRVSEANTQNANGILYDAPSVNAKAERELRQHVADRIEKAKGLYNVLDMQFDYISDRKTKSDYSAMANNLNKAVKAALNAAQDKNQEKRNRKQVEFFKNLRVKRIKLGKDNFVTGDRLIVQVSGKHTPADIANELVQRNLRGPLRKSVTLPNGTTVNMKALVLEVLTAVCISGKTNRLSEETLYTFFYYIDKDYNKELQKELIAKSIESQSVKAIVAPQDEMHLLTPSSAGKGHKKYIFDFMKQYAAAEAEEKIAMEKHIQELIILYFYGPEGYEHPELHNIQIGTDEEYFSSEIQKLLQDINSLTKAIDKLKAENQTYAKQSVNPSKDARIIRNKKKIKENFNEIKNKEDQIKELVIKGMSDRYRCACKYLADVIKKSILGEIPSYKPRTSADIFWIDYVDNTVQKILLDHFTARKTYRFQLGYLGCHVWKEWTQYLASKYIDLGKGVYHFAVPDLSGAANGEEIVIREVLPEFRNGISGFEYERIKAEESLEREMAEYVSFAVNNFARACADDQERSTPGHEDVLQMKLESENPKTFITLYPDADRRILQFFGGQKQFKDNRNCVVNTYTKEQLFSGIKTELDAVRNMTFHFTAKEDQYEHIDHTIANAFFDVEMTDISALFQQKYFSNNVPVFYPISTINDVMGRIYSGKKKRVALVPSFNKIFARTSISEKMLPFIDKGALNSIQKNVDESLIEKYWSCLFFVLKELYYYDFLQDEADVKTRFMKALDNKLNDRHASFKDKQAARDFNDRLKELGEDCSFGEICQGMMMDYMLQNTENQKVRVQQKGSRQSDDGQIYKHFRTVLYLCIREAFIGYLKEKWSLLKKPAVQNKVYTKEMFCTGNKKINLFENLNADFKNDTLMAPWFVTAHFMNPTYLNHLIGSIRNYIQFTTDIEKRAGSVHNRLDQQLNDKISRYQRIVEVLEFALNFCGKTSDCLEDYFGSSDADNAYAEYLANFVDVKVSDDKDAKTALLEFCNQKVRLKNGSEIPVGIYSDMTNLILNKNVIHANMYGNSESLKHSVKKVTLSEIRSFYNLKAELAPVFKKGICTSKDQQEKLRVFQNSRNRIELLDLTTYTEIINDMQAQLINWSYLRERDLMYFQLGYYYTKLFWTSSIPSEDHRRKLVGKKVNIQDGAILYQILAMNVYGLGIIGDKDDKVKFENKRGNAGTSIGIFLKTFENAGSVYMEGLSLFENTDEHDDIIDTRNYIDHFKYFTNRDRSILELYSEIYDRYFRHNHNLKKSVIQCLENTMARNFMTMDKQMEVTTKVVAGREHKATCIEIPKTGIKSTSLTYTYTGKDKSGKDKKIPVLVDARSDKFMSQWHSILTYKETTVI